ncbi:Crp/Fnr family transcriptional regulator [Reichenbachiella agarivorans]|uniref:Crp/Fnr family transcriptional regulator n=1 Tax=Reichenbachiella agarivorans TaxID=2979464 RepID=A0ABY6CMJ9_9BACT|nr:Crp/Fnr family transcriptional regulator [Reichenbachiella agarivorans]UXP30974.1 Crp/Fnr family transcriptional regulator [Reichenbachiella agarivorans]
MNPILTLFGQIAALDDKALTDFSQIIRFDHFSKNTTLLEIGKKAKSMFYIHKGLARAYYYHDGKDVTDYFAIDGQFIGAVPSLFTGQPSHKGIHLIEASDIYHFDAAAFEACCAKHHSLEHATRIITSYALLDEQERIESLRFYSVKERYDLMEKKYPGITNRCPLHYIASYLGTTQVSISRIRAGVQ